MVFTLAGPGRGIIKVTKNDEAPRASERGLGVNILFSSHLNRTWLFVRRFYTAAGSGKNGVSPLFLHPHAQPQGGVCGHHDRGRRCGPSRTRASASRTRGGDPHQGHPRKRDLSARDGEHPDGRTVAAAMNQNFVPVLDDKRSFIGIVKRGAIIQYCYDRYRGGGKGRPVPHKIQTESRV